ncbi:hypothetical protein GA0115249_114648 [Streptomyces sp. PpalLS-921]|nr:hypothetical protein GA0115249_114648 [Streptomyces sp. PpalLS-921]
MAHPRCAASTRAATGVLYEIKDAEVTVIVIHLGRLG